MANTLHSLISPSYLHLICKCPKSLNYDPLDIETNNVQAERGTLQHALLCEKLSIYFSKDFEKVDILKFTQDEIEEVNEVYNYIISRYKKVKCRCSNPEILIEEKLDLNDFLPKDSWGYVDFAMITKTTVYVFDAKFGRVKVEVVDKDNNPNVQLSSYGLGCYFKYRKFKNLKFINLSICQPKLNSYPMKKFSVSKIYEYFMNIVSPAVYKAIKGEGLYTPNSECGYCRLRHHCRAYASEVLAQLQMDQNLPETMSDEEIDFILTKIPSFKKWCDSIWEYAIKKSETTGKKWSNFILTTGRPTRVFTDSNAVIEKAKNAGFEKIVETKIISVAQAEKLLGKSKFGDLLGDYVTYKPGKNTLVFNDSQNKKSLLYNEFKGEK